MPKQIQTPSVGQALVRLFGLKGRYQPVLDETIVPVIEVGKTEETEKRLATAGHSAAAVAAEYSTIQLLNPNDSGVIIRINSFILSDVNSLVRPSINGTWTLGTRTQKASVWREQHAGVPAGEFYQGQSTFLNATEGFISQNLGAVMQYFWDVVLVAGESFILQTSQVNKALIATILWTEEYANVGGPL